MGIEEAQDDGALYAVPPKDPDTILGSIDSLHVEAPVVVEQRQESPPASGETVSDQWGDFDH